MIKAAALIVAEIERLDRIVAKQALVARSAPEAVSVAPPGAIVG